MSHRARRRHLPLRRPRGLTGPISGEGTSPPTSATFLSSDATTLGAWRGHYGSAGWWIAADATSPNPHLPSWAGAVTDGNPYPFGVGTGSPYALRDAAGTSDIAGCWFTGASGTFDIEVAISDGQPHRLALYALDWHGSHVAGPGDDRRSERIDVIDPATGTVLDSRTLSSFQGVYLSWTIAGHVLLRVTNTASGNNAVVAALFFG
jgi:hypothetical protein